MITLYTAVGRFELRRNTRGEQYPVITANNREHVPDIYEMIIWFSLAWNLMTPEELRPVFYRKEREAHVLGDMEFEDYLELMEKRGLIAAGRNYTGYEALYSLVKNLHIAPATSGFLTKLAAFFKLTFIKRIPIAKSIEVFKNGKQTPDERIVMALTKHKMLTTAELIMCVQKGVRSLRDDKTLLDTLYNDEKTTCYNIAVPAKFSGKRQQIIQAVTDLYLRKQIIFERIL